MNLPQPTSLTVLTPANLLARRVTTDAVTDYASALMDACRRFWKASHQPVAVLQLAVLLMDQGRPGVEIQAVGLAGGDALERLKSALAELPVPRLASGAVALVIRLPLGPAQATEDVWQEPFSTGEFDSFALEVARGRAIPAVEIEKHYRQVPQPLGWLQRVGLWVRGKSRPMIAVPRSEPDVPLLPVFSSSLEREQIDQWIAESPGRLDLLVVRAEWHLGHRDMEAAIADCETVLQQRPQDARALCLRGCAHANLDSLSKSLADFDQALAIEPDFVAARFNRAKILIELEALDEARVELERCLRKSRIDVSSRQLLSRLCFHQGQFDKASRLAEEVRAIDPHESGNLGWIAFLLRNQEKFDRWQQVRRDLDHALALEPDNQSVRFERALWLSMTREWDQVIEDCTALIQQPEGLEMEAHDLRAFAFLEMGQLESARADVERTLEMGNQSSQAFLTRARCKLASRDREDIESVASDLERVFDSDPENIYAICLMGDLHQQLGDHEEALEFYDRAIDQAPDSAFLHDNRAQALFSLDRLEEALDASRQAVELDGDNAQFRFTRSWNLHQLNRFDEALVEINAARKLDPDNPAVHFHRANVLLGMADRAEAVESLNRAIELAPDFAEAIALRGRLHSDNADYEAAESDYDRLVKQFPEHFHAYSLRAAARSLLGKEELAQRDIRAAIEINPAAAEAVLLNQDLARAKANLDQQEFDQAIEISSEILEEHDECIPAFMIRASSNWYSERYVEAIEDYTRVLELVDPEQPNAEQMRLSTLGSRGQVYAELGEYDLAVRDLNQVIEANSQDAGPILKAYALSGRGLARVGLSQMDLAEQDFRASVAAAPDNAWAHYNQGLYHFQQRRLPEARFCFQLALQSGNPSLTPRKRSKAESFVRSCQAETGPEGSPGEDPPIAD